MSLTVGFGGEVVVAGRSAEETGFGGSGAGPSEGLSLPGKGIRPRTDSAMKEWRPARYLESLKSPEG